MAQASDTIRRAVESWPGVESGPHRFGGIEFKIGRREIGHLHGERWADLPFPKAVRQQLVSAGRAEPHHVLPDSGWVTKRIRSDADVAEVIALFRLNYERRSDGSTGRPGLAARETITGSRASE